MEINKKFFDKYLKLNKVAVTYNGNNEDLKSLELLGYPIDFTPVRENTEKVKTIIFLEIKPDSPLASIEEIKVSDLDNIRIFHEDRPSFVYKGSKDDDSYKSFILSSDDTEIDIFPF